MNMNKEIIVNARQALQGFMRWMVVDAATKQVVRESGWIKNLILNNGMDQLAITLICDLFNFCVAGIGITPTTESSGATTAVQAGTTVTLSGGSFTFTNTGTDAGKSIKWAGGAEATIVSVTSPTVVEVANSASVSSDVFTAYRTNQTTMASEVKRSNTYLVQAGYTGTTIVGNQFQYRRTYDFTAEVGTVNYTEIGLSWTNIGAATIFSRILLPGPVPVGAGQQLRVVYQLNVTNGPSTPNAKTAIINGWPVSPSTVTTGSEQLQGYGVSIVRSDGATIAQDSSGFCNEPSTSAQIGCYLSTDSSALGTYGTGTSRATIGTATTLTKATYTANNYYQDKTGTFAVGVANRTDWRSMGHGAHNPNAFFAYDANRNCYTFLFDEAQTKDNTHALTLTFRWSWTRVLA